MVPVLAVGFEGLKTRLAVQEETLKTHKEKIAEVKARIEKIHQIHTVETVIKIQEYKRKQRQLVHKVLQIMKSVQVLRNRGYALRADEEQLITRLLAMDRDLAKPSVFRGRLNELWAHVQQMKDANRLLAGLGGDRESNYTVSDPNSLKAVCQVSQLN